MSISDLKILSLEDNPVDAELIREKMISEKFTNLRMEVISTEKEFINRLNTNTYNLILSDYNLPQFTGLEALLIAKKICPEIPFIFVSGTVGEEMAIELLRKGASDYVLKGNLDKLPLAINRSIREVQEQKALKEAEKELRKLSQAVYQSPASIIITNINGDIEFVNPKTISLTGYTKDELIGTNPRIFNSGEIQKEVFENLWETIISGKVWTGELLNRKKNGELYWESASISPIFDENENIIHYLAINEDITEQKRLTLDLIEAKEKAEESDRLKTAFLMNISHEIRTPMNGILGFTELLKTPGLSGDKQLEFINIIKESGERMLNIINDIIDISKIESGNLDLKIEKANVNSILKDLFTFFTPESNAYNIELKVEPGLSDEESQIETDITKLKQILTNLIKNALKFTESGSVKFGYVKKENMLEFFVRDTGIGISPENKDIIFDRFVQVDMSHTRKYEGAGLGLSISKAYIELLGGEIRVESELNKGSTFYFTVPYNHSEKEQIIEKSSPMPVHFEKSINMLIAEDDASVRMYFKELLNIENLNLSFAVNGKEAVEIIKLIQEIDIVLMDLKMPIMDGFEATKQIKKIRKNLPVIAQTAYASPNDEKEAREAGCNDFITKPINYEKLFYLINKYTQN